jgi:hypothetical protein
MQFPLTAHDALSDAFFVSEWGAHLSYRTCHQTFSGLAHRAGICKRPDTGAQAKPIRKSLRISSNLSKSFGLPQDGSTWRAPKAALRAGLASASCKPTSSAERQAPPSRVPDCVVAMLPSSRRQFTVMVNSNFASSSIRQPNIAWPRPSTGPQVFAGLDLTEIDTHLDKRLIPE